MVSLKSVARRLTRSFRASVQVGSDPISSSRICGGRLRFGSAFLAAIACLVLAADSSAFGDTPKKTATTQRYWQSQWEFQDVDVGKLAGRLASIGIDLGLELQGKVSVKFDVGIPLTSLSDGAAYRFDGTLTSPNLSVNRVELQKLKTKVKYRNGLATLSELTCLVADRQKLTSEVPPGKLTGNGTLQLVPQGEAAAALEVQKVGVAALSELIANYIPAANSLLPKSGQVSGTVQFQSPIKSIRDVSTYTLNGNLKGNDLVLAGLPPADVKIDQVVIRDGDLRITGVDVRSQSNRGRSKDIRLTGKAYAPLDRQGPFEFELAADDLPVTELTALLTESSQSIAEFWARGKVDFQVRGKGVLSANLAEARWNVEGAVASPSLQIGGIDLGSMEHDFRWTPTNFDLSPRRNDSSLPDRFKIKRVQANYRLQETSFELTSIVASVFGGTISGSASLPRVEGTEWKADLAWSGIRPELRLPFGRRMGPPLRATLAGNARWQVPYDKLSQPVAHTGTATITASEMTIGDRPVGQLNTELSANLGRVAMTVDGEMFGGKVNAETNGNLLAGDRWSDVGRRLQSPQFQFESVSLRDALDVSDILTGQHLARSWTGKVNGQATIDSPKSDRTHDGIPDGSITLELRDVNYQSRPLSRSLKLDGKVEQNVFSVQSLVGDYAGGSVRTQGRVYLLDSEQNFHPRTDLRLSASRVQLGQGLWFLGETTTRLEGLVSATATISGYLESTRARGSVNGRQLVAYGIPIGSAHSAVNASANLNSLQWSVTFPTVRSSAGGGRIEGELMVRSARASGFDLSSRWKTRRVDFFRLTQQIGRTSALATGEISGELSLRGKSIERVEDLAGRFDFNLGRTRGAALPGIIAASQFLGPVSIANQAFDAGQARGIIGKGSVVIDEFWLGADNALIQADGKVNLRSRRMNLNVLVATGDYRDIAANFTQLAQRYALRSLLPASAILSVTELLRDRTVVLTVLGTLQNPIVRLRPIETFREEAARFLLREGQRLIIAGIFAEAAGELDGGLGGF